MVRTPCFYCRGHRELREKSVRLLAGERRSHKPCSVGQGWEQGYTLIFLEFWRLEVHNLSYGARTKLLARFVPSVDSMGESIPCLLDLEAPTVLGL